VPYYAVPCRAVFFCGTPDICLRLIALRFRSRSSPLLPQAIELDDNYVYFSNRSAAYTSMSRFSEALDDAEACIKRKPDWSKGP
jgi:hypothetical protein